VSYFVCTKRRNDNYHQYGGLDSERFLDYGVEVGHFVEQLKGHGVAAVSTDAVLFFANLCEDFWMISQVLEGIDQAAAHRILAGEQEREDDHGHLTVTELPAAFPFGILNILEPTVKHAGRFTAVCHVDLTLGGSFDEPLEGNLTGPDSPPNFCSGKGKREVDEFEGTGDVPVFVTDLLGGGSRDVVSAENTQGSVHVEMAGDHHEGAGLSIGGGPIAEMLAGNPVLDVKVKTVGDV